MSDDLLEDFKKVGLIHIVVLSGSNVSIISVALFSLLSRLPLLLRSIVGVMSMMMFAIMTGAAPPVVRSVCMTTVPIAIELFRQFRNKKESHVDEVLHNHVSVFIDAHASVYSLVCIGLVLAIFNPLMLIYDMSFQLSFMATFGLMSLSGVMSRICFFIPKKFGIREIVSCSLATQVFVLPLLLLISDEVSLVFLIANILVLPILPLTMLLVFVTMLSSFIMYPVAVVSGHVSWIFLKWIMWVSSYFSGFRFSTIMLTLLTSMEVVMIFIVLAPLSLMLKFLIVTKVK
jgi:competence protein ComEC